jgi:hypothetical protein
MGTEAAWVPLVMAAVGTGTQAYVAHEAAADQDKTAAMGIREQAAHQRQADERVSSEVSALEQSTPEAARAQATGAFMDQLRKSRSQAVPGGVAGASSRYDEDLGAAGEEVQDFGSKVASTLARINAPGLQRQAEGQGFARLSSDLGGLQRSSTGDAFLNQLRLRGIKPDPWLSGAGELVTGVGGGMAANQGRYGGVTQGGTRTDVPVRRTGGPYA